MTPQETPGERPLESDELADILINEFGGTEISGTEQGDAPASPTAPEPGDFPYDGDPGPQE